MQVELLDKADIFSRVHFRVLVIVKGVAGGTFACQRRFARTMQNLLYP